MAIRIDTLQNSVASSTDYPFGSTKDSTTPNLNDGTKITQAVFNDFVAYFTKLLTSAGLVPSNSVDTEGSSQYFDALVNVIQNNSTGSLVVGDIKISGNPTPPNAEWIAAEGLELSRTAYPALFSAWGVQWGSGDGVNTFGTPDFRGEFLRGFDNGRGVDLGRVFGSLQLDTLQSHRHLGLESSLRYISPFAGFSSNSGLVNGAEPQTNGDNQDNWFIGDPSSDLQPGNTVRTSTETRPRNQTVYFYFKAL